MHGADADGSGRQSAHLALVLLHAEPRFIRWQRAEFSSNRVAQTAILLRYRRADEPSALKQFGIL